MSGPKVIRVVTKEELQAICRRLLATVDAAAAEFLRATPAQSKQIARHEIARRRHELEALIDAGRFSEVQRHVPMHLQFYRAEAKRLEREAIAAAERQRKARRNVADAARSLAMAFASAQRSAPTGLANVERSAFTANDQQLTQLQAIVDEAFRLLASEKTVENKLDTKLTRRLAAGTAPKTLAEWIAIQPAAPASRGRLDSVLAELEVIASNAVVQELFERAARISTEPSAGRRSLLEDSLILEASRAVQSERADANLQARARQAIEELAAVAGDESIATKGRLESALQTGEALEPAVITAQHFLEQEGKRLAADARRQAILRGLADLGYEVREGMATALAREGRIVLSRSGATDYGVEIGSPPDAERLQVRVVGSDHPATPRSQDRDRQAEEQWCGDVSTLTASLARSGTDIVIERAAEVGAVPLKTAAEIGRNESGDVGQSKSRERTLR